MVKKRETSYSVKLFQITTNSKKIFSAILGLELLFAIYSLYSPHFSTAPRGRRLKIRYSIFGLTYKTICFFFFCFEKGQGEALSPPLHLFKGLIASLRQSVFLPCSLDPPHSRWIPKCSGPLSASFSFFSSYSLLPEDPLEVDPIGRRLIGSYSWAWLQMVPEEQVHPTHLPKRNNQTKTSLQFGLH